jgi:hypothetical protein
VSTRPERGRGPDGGSAWEGRSIAMYALSWASTLNRALEYVIDHYAPHGPEPKARRSFATATWIAGTIGGRAVAHQNAPVSGLVPVDQPAHLGRGCC